MKKLMTIIVSALCAAVAFTSIAEPITWTGEAGDGLWVTAGNWDLGRVPNAATDDIVIGPFDEPTIVTYESSAYLEFYGSLTLKKNATLSLLPRYGEVNFHVGSKLTVENGGVYMMRKNERSTYNFEDGCTVVLDAGGLITDNGEEARIYAHADSTWKLKGGLFKLRPDDGNYRFFFKGRAAVAGSEILTGYLAPETTTEIHVLDLISGSVQTTGRGWDNGSCLWASEFASPGSYVNFPRYSSGKLIAKDKNWSAQNVFDYWFKGDDTKSRVRYNDTIFQTLEEFNEKMSVAYDETIPGTVVQPIAETPPEHIVISESAPCDVTYDGKAHVPVVISVVYPQTCHIEYSLNAAGEWGREIPMLTAAGEYTVHVRVIDDAQVYEPLEKSYTAYVRALSLEGAGTVADIPAQEATGEPIEPEVVVTATVGGSVRTLLRDTDYEVEYSDNVNPGLATATVTGIGNFCGVLVKQFQILAKMIEEGDVYVDVHAAAGGDGSSWAKAMSSLPDAVRNLGSERKIYVKGGVYNLLQDIELSERTNVQILGGYAGDGEPGTRDPESYPTVLVGRPESGTRVLTILDCSGVTVGGLTLTGGCETRMSSACIEDYAENLFRQAAIGGGLLVQKSSDVEIADCVITNNVATSSASGDVFTAGGGVMVLDSDVAIRRCLIGGNRAVAANNKCAMGGGAYLNVTRDATRTYSISVEGTIIRENEVCGLNASVRCGGVGCGGGLWFSTRREDSSLTMDNCLIAYNAAYDFASRRYYAGYGAGFSGNNCTIRRSTIAFNAGQGIQQLHRGNASDRFPVVVTDSVVWGNGIDISSDDAVVSLTNTVCGTGVSVASEASFRNDPLFGKGFRLRAESPYRSVMRCDGTVGRLGYAPDDADGMLDVYEVDAAKGETITSALAKGGEGVLVKVKPGTYDTALGETFPLVGANRRMVFIEGPADRSAKIVGPGSAGAVPVFDLDNSRGIILRGLTVSGGYNVIAAKQSDGSGYGCGGGIRAYRANLVLENASVTGNVLKATSTACDEWNNYGALGGGIGSRGSGLSIDNCTVEGNSITGTTSCPSGVGIGVHGAASSIRNTIVRDNFVDPQADCSSGAGDGLVAGGGGIGMSGSRLLCRNLLITGNSFAWKKNSAGYGDGVCARADSATVCSLTMENCTVADNNGRDGVLVSSKASGYLTNCAIVGHTYDVNRMDLANGKGTTLQGVNCYYGTAHDDGFTSEQDLIVAQLGDHPFKGTGAAAYAPSPDSPLINNGVVLDWMSGATDLAGNPRLARKVPDIGCYEAGPMGLTLIFR